MFVFLLELNICRLSDTLKHVNLKNGHSHSSHQAISVSVWMAEINLVEICNHIAQCLLQQVVFLALIPCAMSQWVLCAFGHRRGFLYDCLLCENGG